MITIIAGTNRKKSNSLNVAKSYLEAFKAKGLESQILDLADIPSCFVDDMYDNHTEEVKGIIEKYIVSVRHFVFTIPEYNGTFSGALKLFMDGLDPAYFNHKSAMLAGVASGRAGNIGISIVLVNGKEKGKLSQIEKIIQKKFVETKVPTKSKETAAKPQTKVKAEKPNKNAIWLIE